MQPRDRVSVILVATVDGATHGTTIKHMAPGTSATVAADAATVAGSLIALLGGRPPWARCSTPEMSAIAVRSPEGYRVWVCSSSDRELLDSILSESIDGRGEGSS